MQTSYNLTLTPYAEPGSGRATRMQTKDGIRSIRPLVGSMAEKMSDYGFG